MMHWIWTILIGFVAGLIAKAVTPGTGPSGFWLTAILGIAGALAATFIGQMVGFYLKVIRQDSSLQSSARWCCS